MLTGIIVATNSNRELLPKAIRASLGVKTEADVKEETILNIAAFEQKLRTNLLFRLLFLGQYDLVALYFHPKAVDQTLFNTWDKLRGAPELVTLGTPSLNTFTNPLTPFTESLLKCMDEIYEQNQAVQLVTLRVEHQQLVALYYTKQTDVLRQELYDTTGLINRMLVDPEINAATKLVLQNIKKGIETRLAINDSMDIPEDRYQDIKQLREDINNALDAAAIPDEYKKEHQARMAETEVQLKANDAYFLPLIQELTVKIEQGTADWLMKISNVINNISNDLLTDEQKKEINDLLKTLQQQAAQYKEAEATEKTQYLIDYAQTLDSALDYLQGIHTATNLMPELHALASQVAAYRTPPALGSVIETEDAITKQHTIRASLEQLRNEPQTYQLDEELIANLFEASQEADERGIDASLLQNMLEPIRATQHISVTDLAKIKAVVIEIHALEPDKKLFKQLINDLTNLELSLQREPNSLRP
jgi:hypothetical protein